MSKLIAAAVLLGSFTGSAILFSAGCVSHAQDEAGSATLFASMDADASPPLTKGSIYISEVFTSGGLTGAAKTKDYVELFNKTTKDIVLDGLSLQTSTAKDTNFTIVVKLTGTIKASSFFLVELKGSGGAGGDAITDPDQQDNTADLGAKDGKVALVANTMALNCGGSSPTLTPCAASKYLDLVGWGGTSAAAGNGLPIIDDAANSATRKDPCVDSADNSKDFALVAAAPQNSASDPKVCPVKPPDAGVDAGPPKQPAPPVKEPEPGDELPFDGGYRPEAGPSAQSAGGDDSCAVGVVGSPSGFSLFAPLAGLGLAVLALGRRRKK